MVVWSRPTHLVTPINRRADAPLAMLGFGAGAAVPGPADDPMTERIRRAVKVSQQCGTKLLSGSTASRAPRRLQLAGLAVLTPDSLPSELAQIETRLKKLPITKADARLCKAAKDHLLKRALEIHESFGELYERAAEYKGADGCVQLVTDTLAMGADYIGCLVLGVAACRAEALAASDAEAAAGCDDLVTRLGLHSDLVFLVENIAQLWRDMTQRVIEMAAGKPGMQSLAAQLEDWDGRNVVALLAQAGGGGDSAAELAAAATTCAERIVRTWTHHGFCGGVLVRQHQCGAFLQHILWCCSEVVLVMPQLNSPDLVAAAARWVNTVVAVAERTLDQG